MTKHKRKRNFYGGSNIRRTIEFIIGYYRGGYFWWGKERKKGCFVFWYCCCCFLRWWKDTKKGKRKVKSKQEIHQFGELHTLLWGKTQKHKVRWNNRRNVLFLLLFVSLFFFFGFKKKEMLGEIKKMRKKLKNCLSNPKFFTRTLV